MSFSISEMLVVLLIALLVIKPEQLPDVAHAFGRVVQVVRDLFKKVKTEVNGFIELEKPERKREQ